MVPVCAREWFRSAPDGPIRLRLPPSSIRRAQSTLASGDHPHHRQCVPPLAKGGFVRSAPTVVPITEFRRDAARIIHQMVASGAPVYVTQNGRAAAVLLARDAYEGLLYRLAVRASATPGVVDLSMAGEAQNPGPAVVAGAEGRATAGSVHSERVPSESGTSWSGGPFRGSSGNGWQLVESRYGLVDPETADFLEPRASALSRRRGTAAWQRTWAAWQRMRAALSRRTRSIGEGRSGPRSARGGARQARSRRTPQTS